jgi:hypothetical protein
MPRTDAKADAFIPMHFSTPTHFLLTLDINATHFNGLPPFPNFEISRIFPLPLPRCYKQVWLQIGRWSFTKSSMASAFGSLPRNITVRALRD